MAKEEIIDDYSLDDLDFTDEEEVDNGDSIKDVNDFAQDNDFLDDGSFMYTGNDGYTTMDKHNDLLRELTDFAPFLKDKFKSWLGLVYDETTEEYKPKEYTVWDNYKHKYVKRKVQPIMNLLCAEWCINFLRDYARKNNMLTSLDEEEYKLLISDVVDHVWLYLVSKRDYFGLQSDDDIYTIAVSLEHATRLVLTGAGNGGYRKVFTETTNRNENVNLTAQDQFDYSNRSSKKDIGFFGSIKKTLLGGR